MAFCNILVLGQLTWLTSSREEGAPWPNKNTEGKKKTAADDGVASSSKNIVTGPFHLSSRVGVSNGKPPNPIPQPSFLLLTSIYPISNL